MMQCVCGKKRNTSGGVVAYSNYRDMRYTDDYAMTSRINRTSAEERKIMEELLPIDGESLDNFVKRTAIAEQKLVEHAVAHHLYGTKRVWSCHTTSRYCFICTMAQFIECTRAILMSFQNVEDVLIRVDDSEMPPKISLDYPMD